MSIETTNEAVRRAAVQTYVQRVRQATEDYDRAFEAVFGDYIHRDGPFPRNTQIAALSDLKQLQVSAICTAWADLARAVPEISNASRTIL